LKGCRDVNHKCPHCEAKLGEFNISKTVKEGVDKQMKEMHEQQKHSEQKA
jgi:hypothetical protein